MGRFISEESQYCTHISSSRPTRNLANNRRQGPLAAIACRPSRIQPVARLTLWTDVPTNANATCVGTTSEMADEALSCQGCPNQSVCASGEAKAKAQALGKEVDACVGQSNTKNSVLSGKGGEENQPFLPKWPLTWPGEGKKWGY